MDPRQPSQMNNFDNQQNQRRDDLLDLTLRLGISTLNPTYNANAFTGTQDTNSLGDYISNPTGSVRGNGHLYYESYQEIEFEFPAPPEMEHFCLINISRRRPNAGGSRRRSTTRRRSPAPDDQSRSCTNYNCRVTNSPMWRRGPLGPKTLCNACGIKYRKLKLKEEGQAEEGAARQAWPGLM